MSNILKTASVTFSLYTNEDYEGFFVCINDFYKGGYPYKEYLDRDNLRNLTEKKDIIITLAKDSLGRIVGTSSALRMNGRFEGSVLLLLRCVLHEMRGMGIGTKQEDFLLEQIQKNWPETLSLYADVMTHNAVSQTTMVHKGFVFCGLRMTLYKNEIIAPYLKYENNTKMSQAIYCKNNSDIKSISLFAPKEHHKVLKEIYDSLGVSLNFHTDDTPEGGECIYKTEKNELHKSVQIFVDRHGDTKKLTEEIEKIILSGYTAAAYVNMSLVGYTKTYKALKKYGFYFSGVKPLSKKGEYSVLSNSDGCILVLDDIKLPEEAKSLYQTILKEIKK